ncbi:hypothetical protein TNCV_277101 [Trichonephila clavipes]|uniref:Uncharacterized protein n=1 Tax=Trichonephila clavipes TaxID=2585209 RepID=A0A8X6VGP0_TRICX|nr:hypothetical protein TNCV_277101 [Trichonephila clavipes]
MVPLQGRKSPNRRRFPFWKRTKYGKDQPKFEKVSVSLDCPTVLLDCSTVSLDCPTVSLDCPTVSSEELCSVDYNVSTAPIMTDKDILEFFQSTKNIIEADSDEENEMNYTAPIVML